MIIKFYFVFQVKSMRNQSIECHYPLVKTSYKKNWYGGINGCGLRCNNQFYSKDEHAEIQTIIAVLGSLSMFCNLFSVVSIQQWLFIEYFKRLINSLLLPRFSFLFRYHLMRHYAHLGRITKI